MQNVRTIHSSWITDGTARLLSSADVRIQLGHSLLQLVVNELEGKITSKSADIIATLAFLAGRIVQRSVFYEQPKDFRLDQSANGISFLRCDAVTARLFAMKQGTLASKLVESALMAGANRFPDFQTVFQGANEGMQRWGSCKLPDNTVSDAPQMMAAHIQTDVDTLIALCDDRQVLIAGIFDACGLAINYARHKLEPVFAVELAMGIALYGGWIDQRKFNVR